MCAQRPALLPNPGAPCLSALMDGRPLNPQHPFAFCSNPASLKSLAPSSALGALQLCSAWSPSEALFATSPSRTSGTIPGGSSGRLSLCPWVLGRQPCACWPQGLTQPRSEGIIAELDLADGGLLPHPTKMLCYWENGNCLRFGSWMESLVSVLTTVWWWLLKVPLAEHSLFLHP